MLKFLASNIITQLACHAQFYFPPPRFVVLSPCFTNSKLSKM